jgi:isocitrate lyase
MQQVKAGIKAIYLSGWQVAADNNSYAAMYPDQSLYPVDSVPKVVERINNTFRRADEIQWSKGINPGDAGYIDNFAPIVADAEAGFGGVLNAFELMKAMIKRRRRWRALGRPARLGQEVRPHGRQGAGAHR